MSCSSPGWPLDLDGNVVPPRRVPAVLVSAGGLDRWSPSRRRAKPLLTMGRGAGAGYKTRLTGLTGSLHYKSSSPFPPRDALKYLPHFIAARALQGPRGQLRPRRPRGCYRGDGCHRHRALRLHSGRLRRAGHRPFPLGYSRPCRETRTRTPRNSYDRSAETYRSGC